MKLNALRTALWQKAKGNDAIARGNHHYEDIRRAILKETGYQVSKDTIRNFLEDRHDPQPKTLDIYATYILGGDKTRPKTYQDFEQWHLNISSHRKLLTLVRWSKGGIITTTTLLLVIIALVAISINRLSESSKGEAGVEGLNNPRLEQTVLDYHFTNLNLSQLQQDGWFFFGDSVNIDLWLAANQPDDKYMTLTTLLGGPWLENRDYEPTTLNLLAHPLHLGDCSEIMVKIVDFNPNQRYQQAGFFLFYNDTEIPSFSYQFACGGPTNHAQASIRLGKYHNEHLIPYHLYGHRTKVSKILNPGTDRAIAEAPVDSIVLKLTVEGDQYFLKYKIDNQPYQAVASKRIPFGAPIYLALSAFQGRPDIPSPVWPVADIIEAKFDYVKILPCK